MEIKNSSNNLLGFNENIQNWNKKVQKHTNPKIRKPEIRRGSKQNIYVSAGTLQMHEKTSRDVEFISRALSKHFIFTNLPIDSRVELISKMDLFRIDPQQIIFKHFFIIAKGTVEVFVNDACVNVLASGESFGELALLHDFPRSASIIAKNTVYVWVLHRTDFKQAVEYLNSQNYNENKNFLEVLPLFSTLTNEQKSILLESLSEFKYRPKQHIVNEGDPGDLCFFIKKGTVQLKKGEKMIGEIKVGGYFGEQSLLTNSVRTATVIALTEVKCIVLSRVCLEKALGSQLQNVIFDNSKKIAIEKNEVLSKLNKKKRTKLIEALTVINFKSDDLVIQKNTLKKSFL